MIQVMTHTDICAPELLQAIVCESQKSSRTLLISATATLKKLRQNSEAFRALGENRIVIDSISGFERQLTKKIYESGDCIATADQRYVLSKLIEYYFADDPAAFRSYFAVRNELFDLFSGLSFRNAIIQSAAVDQIRQDYSDVEARLFDLYRLYRTVLQDLCAACRGSAPSDLLQNIIGDSIIIHDRPVLPLFQKKRLLINETVKSYDAVIMDGFLFFDDFEKEIVQAALANEKKVYLISKQFEDGTGGFILNQSLSDISDYKVVFSQPCQPQFDTALDYARNIYPNVLDKKGDVKATLGDESIKFITPFVSRDEELRYVVKSISNKIRAGYDGTRDSLYRSLGDIAVITSISKADYEERINDLFTENGVFVLKEKESLPAFPNIDNSTVGEVYFSRSEFLADDLCHTDGSTVSFSEKLDFFERAFYKIQVSNHIRPISSYPIGQFIIGVYGIISKGITPERFKSILYSNWRFTTGKTAFKWSNLVGDFKIIEPWYEKSADLKEWIKITAEILCQKAVISNNALYVYHPFNAISVDSLSLIEDVLKELDGICEAIIKTQGGIQEHISVLKSVVMQADDILSKDNEDLEYEQQIVKRIVQTVSKQNNRTVIGKISSKFFADNIRSMLAEYDDALEQGPLCIDVVNLENVKDYKTGYFIMCESDHYPRTYDASFPYTDSVMDILSNEKYGLNSKPQERFGREYHTQLERYLLKNVLDFVRDELVITSVEREAGNKKKPAVFCMDIASMFDGVIPYSKAKIAQESDLIEPVTRSKAEHLPKKTDYTLTELAIFKLCPRLYYHRRTDSISHYSSKLQLRFYFEAILYCDTYHRFMDYNVEHKAIYEKNDTTYIDVIERILEESLGDAALNFALFSGYEIADAKKNVLGKLLSGIENSKQYLKGNRFTIIDYKNSTYRGNGYTVTIEHDNRFVDYDLKTWRMSQNKTYIEFLVLKTSDRSSELVHYKDMIKALDEAEGQEDRVNLISRIIAKINIQFDSKRFAADGLKRTDGLVEEIESFDFAGANAMPSNYCTYCRLNDVCMGS